MRPPFALPAHSLHAICALLARCLQHETDHTLGRVFGDRLPNKARKRLAKDMEKAAEDFPEGWPAS